MAAHTAATEPASSPSAARSTTITGLRSRIAACTSWNPDAATAGCTEPVTSTPRSAARQGTAAGRPVPASTPRHAPDRVRTPPDLTNAAVNRRRHRLTSRHSSVCSQSSQQATAASPAARMRAIGNCPGNQRTEPVDAVPRWASRAGPVVTPVSSATTARGAARKPARAAAGPIASTQASPQAAGTASQTGRHRVIFPMAWKATASPSVTGANIKPPSTPSTARAASSSRRRGVPSGIR